MGRSTAIALAPFINAGVGFWQEYKADTAIEALKQRLALSAHVKRDGVWREIAAQTRVPGDLIAIEIGDIVPADATLVAGECLSVDQSAFAAVSWDMPRVLTMASSLGLYGVFERFVLCWIARDRLHLPVPVRQAVIFLKRLVSGPMTGDLTGNRGWGWQRPWPRWLRVVPCAFTQRLGTLIVVCGVAMAPIGCELALFV